MSSEARKEIFYFIEVLILYGRMAIIGSQIFMYLKEKGNLQFLCAHSVITIKTLLSRSEGRVSTGQPAFFSAYQFLSATDSINEERFEGLLNNSSGSNGQLSEVKLFPDTPGIDTLKTLHLQVKALNDNGDTIRRTVILNYKRQ